MQAQPTIEASGAAPSLRSRTVRSAFLTLFGHGSGQALRLVSNMVLTRLLFPEAFGVMAIVRLVANGLGMVSNVGIQPAIIRHERGDQREFLNTAWTLSVIRGGVLVLAASALAIPVAAAYDVPELRWMIPVVSLGALMKSFEATKLIIQSRKLTLGRPVAIELVGRIAALVVMIAVALRFPSVWVLVFGGLVHSAVRLVLSYAAIPGPRNHFRWEGRAAREILHFGKWIFVSTLFAFLAQRMDVIMLGRLVPLDVLGVYSVGITISAIPSEALTRLSGSVLLPALAAANREGFESFQRIYHKSRQIILSGAQLVLLGAGIVSPSFFYYLYDARYADAAWIAQLSMIVLWFSFMHNSAARALLALGDSRTPAVSDGAKAMSTFVGCLVGWQLGGMPGVVIGSASGQIVGHAINLRALSELGIHSVRQDALHTFLGLGLGLGACWLPYYFAAAPGATWSVALITLVWGPLLSLPFALWVGRMLWRELRGA